jgi:hypothetical protein
MPESGLQPGKKVIHREPPSEILSLLYVEGIFFSTPLWKIYGLFKTRINSGFFSFSLAKNPSKGWENVGKIFEIFYVIIVVEKSENQARLFISFLYCIYGKISCFFPQSMIKSRVRKYTFFSVIIDVFLRQKGDFYVFICLCLGEGFTVSGGESYLHHGLCLV